MWFAKRCRPRRSSIINENEKNNENIVGLEGGFCSSPPSEESDAV